MSAHPLFLTAKPHIVRRLGGTIKAAAAALVLELIVSYCHAASDETREADGGRYWRASHATIAAAVGLTERATRTSLETLQAAGLVESTARDSTGTDRSLCWRPTAAYRALQRPRVTATDLVLESHRTGRPIAELLNDELGK